MAIDRDDRTVNNGRVVERERPSSNMGWLIALLVIVGLVMAAFALGLIDIDQTRGAKLPDVKVETSGGQAPAFDVNTANIDVGKKQETVKVPTVDVGSKDTQVTMPTISVDPAGDPNKKE